MPAELSWIPGTSVLEYTPSDDLSPNEYQNFLEDVAGLFQSTERRPYSMLVDLHLLRTLHPDMIKVHRNTRMIRLRKQLRCVAFVGASPFYKNIVLMITRALGGDDRKLAFFDTREEALMALTDIMAQCA